jgi:hypothetical protein
MLSRLLSNNAEDLKREALSSEAGPRPNDEGEGNLRRETESKLADDSRRMGPENLEIRREELELKREELKLKREEQEFKRKEAEVRMKQMEQDQLMKTFDWEMQVYLADRAEFLEQKKQWMAANGKKWESDADAALRMGCKLPRRPVMPVALSSGRGDPGCPSQ